MLGCRGGAACDLDRSQTVKPTQRTICLTTGSGGELRATTQPGLARYRSAHFLAVHEETVKVFAAAALVQPASMTSRELVLRGWAAPR